MPHKFDAARAANLEKSDRKQQFPPHKILKEMGLKKDMSLADIGCGGGFFTLPAAEIVGSSGKIWALDISETMLQRLRDKQPPAHVIIKKSGESSFPVADKVVDFVLMSSVLHEADHAEIFLTEAHRILKPNGRLVVIEHEKKQEQGGPPEIDRITKDHAQILLQQAGFIVVQVSSLNNSHYQIIGERK